jgi:hypothetical protein
LIHKNLHIAQFNGGWRPDIPELKLGINNASLMQNVDMRNGYIETIAGKGEAFTGLPASLQILSMYEFPIQDERTGTNNEVLTGTLVYGKLSNRDVIYVTPILNPTNNLQWQTDKWLELTEFKDSAAMTAGTTTTKIFDTSLTHRDVNLPNTVATDNYYVGSIVYNTNRTTAAFVTASSVSENSLTLSWPITGQVAGDSYWMMRSNIYDRNKNLLFAPTTTNYISRENELEMFNGSKGFYPSRIDLSLRVILNEKQFDESALTYSGYWLTRSNLEHMRGVDIFTAIGTTGAGNNRPLPAVNSDGQKFYIVTVVPVYDGYQESIIEHGQTPFDRTAFAISANGVMEYGSNDVIGSFNIRIWTGENGANMMPLLAMNDTGGAFDQVIFDRRVTHFNVYMAQAEPSREFHISPISEWRLVKRIGINDSNWNGTLPNMNYSFTINGAEWTGAGNTDVSQYQGHDSFRIDANVTYATNVKGVIYYGNVHSDKRRKDYVVRSPVKAAGREGGLNMYLARPLSGTETDMSIEGIPIILSLQESFGSLVVFGRDRIYRINPTNPSASANASEVGLSSEHGIIKLRDLIYFTSEDDIYVYIGTHREGGIVKSIAKGYIRELWKSFTKEQRNAAALGYDRRYQKLLLAVAGRVFVMNLPTAIADSLTEDNEFNYVWSGEIMAGVTIVRFYTNKDGECIGIDTAGKAWTLFKDGVANTMVYESGAVDDDFDLEVIKLYYKSATIQPTVEVYDLEKSTTETVRKWYFPTLENASFFKHYRGVNARIVKVKLTGGLGTRISQFKAGLLQEDED